MIREGIYQTIKPHSVAEKHGGTNIRHSIYWNLCFYPKTGKVAMFGGDKDFLLPYKTEAFDLKGELISCSDQHVEFYIINPYTNVRKLFKGTIKGKHTGFKVLP